MWRLRKQRKSPRGFGRRSRRGFTTVEVLIAGAVGALVGLSALSLTVMAGRLQRSVSAQQSALRKAKTAMERMNRELRLATTPLRITNDAGVGSTQGNRVGYNHLGEAQWSRAFELKSPDGDLATPWDNQLIFDPNTGVDGDEEVVATGIMPLSPDGAFSYAGATTPLVIRMRVGDSPDPASAEKSNRRTGPGLQGAEINIAIAPRN